MSLNSNGAAGEGAANLAIIPYNGAQFGTSANRAAAQAVLPERFTIQDEKNIPDHFKAAMADIPGCMAARRPRINSSDGERFDWLFIYPHPVTGEYTTHPDLRSAVALLRLKKIFVNHKDNTAGDKNELDWKAAKKQFQDAISTPGTDHAAALRLLEDACTGYVTFLEKVSQELQTSANYDKVTNGLALFMMRWGLPDEANQRLLGVVDEAKAKAETAHANKITEARKVVTAATTRVKNIDKAARQELKRQREAEKAEKAKRDNEAKRQREAEKAEAEKIVNQFHDTLQPTYTLSLWELLRENSTLVIGTKVVDAIKVAMKDSPTDARKAMLDAVRNRQTEVYKQFLGMLKSTLGYAKNTSLAMIQDLSTISIDERNKVLLISDLDADVFANLWSTLQENQVKQLQAKEKKHRKNQEKLSKHADLEREAAANSAKVYHVYKLLSEAEHPLLPKQFHDLSAFKQAILTWFRDCQDNLTANEISDFKYVIDAQNYSLLDDLLRCNNSQVESEEEDEEESEEPSAKRMRNDDGPGGIGLDAVTQ